MYCTVQCVFAIYISKSTLKKAKQICSSIFFFFFIDGEHLKRQAGVILLQAVKLLVLVPELLLLQALVFCKLWSTSLFLSPSKILVITFLSCN